KIVGYDGDDTIDGGAGDDTVDGYVGNDTVRGGDGNDIVLGDHYEAAGHDVMDGGPGYDRITTDYTLPEYDANNPDGAITFDAGPGKDRVDADTAGGDCGPKWCKYPYGNDTIELRDGEIDSVTCGAGDDTVRADSNDVVAPDCEHVERGGVAPGPDTGGEVTL